MGQLPQAGFAPSRASIGPVSGVRRIAYDPTIAGVLSTLSPSAP